MLQVSPLSPLRACASVDSGTVTLRAAPFALGHVSRGSLAGAAVGRIGVGQSSWRSPSRVTSRGRTRSRGTSAGQYATTSCDCGRPPVTATPGGPERMTPGTSFENCSILDLSASRTDNRNSTSGGSTGGASGPQHAEWPISSTSVAANDTPRRFQNKSENARAFSAAAGAEMISVPLAFQPSKYEQLTLSDDG